MATEWSAFLVHRGIDVEEGPSITIQDAILAVLHLQDHVPSNSDEDGIVHKPLPYPKPWDLAKDTNNYGPRVKMGPNKVSTSTVGNPTRGVTLKIPTSNNYRPQFSGSDPNPDDDTR